MRFPILFALALSLAMLALGDRAVNPAPPAILATFDEMPKVVALPDGRLMAFFHSLTGEMKEATARYSSDGGKTWGKPETLFKLPEEAGAFGYSLVFIDRQSELHMFLFCDAHSGVIHPNPRARAMRSGLG